MDWKQLPRLDEDLPKYLRNKFPGEEYTDFLNSEAFTRLAAKQKGRIEVIQAIESVIKLQNKRR
jgi:hypothetical protein